jgi:hypothetical protein
MPAAGIRAAGITCRRHPRGGPRQARRPMNAAVSSPRASMVSGVWPLDPAARASSNKVTGPVRGQPVGPGQLPRRRRDVRLRLSRGPPFGWGWLGNAPRRARPCQSAAEISAGRQATARLTARQVRRRHRIKVIRGNGAPQNRSTADRRECAGSVRRGAPVRRPSRMELIFAVRGHAGLLRSDRRRRVWCRCCGDAYQPCLPREMKPLPPGSRYLGTCDDSGPVRRLTCSC